MASTLAITYSSGPIGRASVQLRGECPVWRATRSSIGQLLLALPTAQHMLESTAATNQRSETLSASTSTIQPFEVCHSKNSNARVMPRRLDHLLTYLSHSYYREQDAESSSVGTSTAGSSGKFSGRLTPGKAKAQERVMRRQKEDSALQQELEEREGSNSLTDTSPGSSPAGGGVDIDYDHYWSVFHFAIASARADITSLIFRKFRLYGTNSDYPNKYAGGQVTTYPSPSQLALLATLYNHPQALMVTMLYSSTAAASASGYGSRGNSRVNGEEKGPSDVTRPLWRL